MRQRVLWSLIALVLWHSGAQAATMQTSPGQLTTSLNSLHGGDELVLACGTYNAVIPAGAIPSGSAGAPTIIRAATPRCAILQPTFGTSRIVSLGEGVEQHDITLDGLVLDGSSTGASIAALAINGQAGSRNLTITNVEIRNLHGTASGMSTAFGIHYGWFASDAGIVIRNSSIHDIGLGDTTSSDGWGYAIYLSAAYLTFENNEISNTSGFAIHGYAGGGDVSHNIIRNNYIHDTGAAVLLCHNQNQIVGNILARVSAGGPACQANQAMCGGIMVGGACSGVPATGNQVVNNTIYASRGACIRLSFDGGTSTSGNTIRDNICYQNGDDVVSNAAGNTVDHNLLGTDPQFVNAAQADYRLQPTSPARGTGVAAPVMVSGQNTPPDIGACPYGVERCPMQSTSPTRALPAPTRLRVMHQ